MTSVKKPFSSAIRPGDLWGRKGQERKLNWGAGGSSFSKSITGCIRNSKVSFLFGESTVSRVRKSKNLMQHMQYILFSLFSNNIFSSFRKTSDIKPRFKAVKEKVNLSILVNYINTFLHF